MRCICERPRRAPAGATIGLCLALIAGCGTGTPAHRTVDPGAQHADIRLQAALLRWNRCVRRHVDPEPGPDAAEGQRRAVQAARTSGSRPARACEGYRRDVAQRFPPHLAPRVHATLSARERGHGADAVVRPDTAAALMSSFETIFSDP